MKIIWLLLISFAAFSQPSDPSKDPDKVDSVKVLKPPPSDPAGDPDSVYDSLNIVQTNKKTVILLYYKKKRIAVYVKKDG